MSEKRVILNKKQVAYTLFDPSENCVTVCLIGGQFLYIEMESEGFEDLSSLLREGV